MVFYLKKYKTGSFRQLELLIDLHLHMKMHINNTPSNLFYICEEDQQVAHFFINLFQLNYPRHVSNK